MVGVCDGALWLCLFKQKTAYDMRIGDWSADVCSSDLALRLRGPLRSFSPPTPASGGPWGFWAVLEAPMVFTFQPPFSAGLSGYCAEIGAGLCCAYLGLPNVLHDSHASYVAHWLGILRGDTTAILHAPATAEPAFAYLTSFGSATPAAPQ